MSQSHLYSTVQQHTLCCMYCSDEVLADQDSFSPPPSPVKPVERERIPSSQMRKRRTIYTAGTYTHTRRVGPREMTLRVAAHYAHAYLQRQCLCKTIPNPTPKLSFPYLLLHLMSSFFFRINIVTGMTSTLPHTHTHPHTHTLTHLDVHTLMHTH